jgi:hypothetical protein
MVLKSTPLQGIPKKGGCMLFPGIDLGVNEKEPHCFPETA